MFVVCRNSLDRLTKIEGLSKNDKGQYYDYSKINKEIEMNKVLYNQLIEIKSKDELHEIKKIMT